MMTKVWKLDEESEIKALATIGRLIVGKADRLVKLDGPCVYSDELAGEIVSLAKALTLIAESVRNYSYEE